MDDQAYCEMFYAAHYLPVAVYAGGSFLCSAGFYVEGDPYPFVLPKLMELGSPAVYVSSATGYYGYVQCKDGVHSLVLGPAYSTPCYRRIYPILYEQTRDPSDPLRRNRVISGRHFPIHLQSVSESIVVPAFHFDRRKAGAGAGF